MKICFSRQELLDDIADAAYLTADVASANVDPHTLHQTLDLCEGNNRLRVNRLLDLAFAEGCRILRPILDPHHPPAVTPSRLTLTLRPRPAWSKDCGANEVQHIPAWEQTHSVRLQLREYMVATVLWQWLEHTLPLAAPAWREQSTRHAHSLLPTLHLTRPLSPW